MANQQGTGKHPHKDSEEPYPHTKNAGSQSGGEHRSEGGHSSSGGEHGSSSHSSSSGSERGSSHSSGESSSHSGSSSRGSESSDLKSREYKDEHGNVHHHTHTSKDMQDKK